MSWKVLSTLLTVGVVVAFYFMPTEREKNCKTQVRRLLAKKNWENTCYNNWGCEKEDTKGGCKKCMMDNCLGASY